MMPSLLDHFHAMVPADLGAALVTLTGETPGRIEQMLAGALPLLAAALPGAAPAGLDALLDTAPLASDLRGKDSPGDMLLRRLFGADIDPLARSLAGSARSSRAAALILLNALLPALAAALRRALGAGPHDRATVLAVASAGRAGALAALPPQLTFVLSNYPDLARRINPPPPPKRRKPGAASSNWMLALIRRMRGSAPDQSLPR